MVDQGNTVFVFNNLTVYNQVIITVVYIIQVILTN